MTTAHAQPAMTPPQYAPQLTTDDLEAIHDGYISQVQVGVGAGAAIFLGFGVGQAVEGRWLKTGWIMTVGETASLMTFLVAIAPSFGDCFDDCRRTSQTRAVLGLGSLAIFGGLRIWEVVDSISGPMQQNRRYLAARARHPDFYVNPVSQGDGAVVGLAMRF
ncbi:MAG: hypothetical protein QM831_41780 [Kofleriaceae bacterium]